MIMLMVVVAVIALLLVQHLLRQRRQQRLQYLQKYPFHRAYFSALQADYPRLGRAELLLADDALRQFFIMHWRYPKLGLNMPSKLADALWHAFILDTRRYEVFCKKAFGHTFHHIPTFETVSATAGTRRSQLQATWSAAMRTKHLLPRALIAGVPVLFALDGHAQIDDGMHYSMRDMAYWAAQMRADAGNSSGGCGGSSNNSSSSGCSSTASGYASSADCDSSTSDGGSDGGSSCGGGGGCGGGGSD